MCQVGVPYISVGVVHLFAKKLCAPCVLHVLQCSLDTSYTGNVVLTCRPCGEESIHNYH